MDKPKWTTEPPTKPGWYWRRWVDRGNDYVGQNETYHLENGFHAPSGSYLEWWPVPIEEPPR